MKTEFMIALTQLAAEKHLPKEVVLAAIESALVSAYKKDAFTAGQDITAKINPNTGEVKVFVKKTVVETPTDPAREISLAEARKINKSAQLGEVISIECTPPNAGRIAAQTARQVILQRLHEAEHRAIYEEFTGKEGDIVTGTVIRITPEQIYVDLGRTEAVLPASEQVPNERYRIGRRLKFYVLEVVKTTRGPQIVLSRSHRNLLRRLLELEIPEIASGVIEIKAIAREAGYRSKVAVTAHQPGVDPVGSCVGLRGIRIQSIVNELNGEKIDVIEWSQDPATFIAHALSPAQVVDVQLNEAENTAVVTVPDRQLSLAIGREGQNARLAARLTGWRIDIKSASAVEAEKAAAAAVAAEARAKVQPEAPAPEPVAVAAEGAPTTEAKEEPLAVEETVEEEAVEEAVVPATDYELVLTSGTAPAAKAVEIPQIRFAEDILPARQEKVKKSKKESETAKGKEKIRKARPRPAYIDEDEFEE